jgi:hypothetical protein
VKQSNMCVEFGLLEFGSIILRSGGGGCAWTAPEKKEESRSMRSKIKCKSFRV